MLDGQIKIPLTISIEYDINGQSGYNGQFSKGKVELHGGVQKKRTLWAHLALRPSDFDFLSAPGGKWPGDFPDHRPRLLLPLPFPEPARN